ncbi:UDP-glucuronosyltransferase 1-5 [Orchesella cincta]|uniref:UDP-glucuronosyltransferase 1-5 n=1 Tax=Orchesella cincta TaxID=48709 RepID=A0A1D2M1E3_ORCCI|nr:UDP-glucuronosyltransferase 1-5 [Orchesella cincta]
MAQVEYSGIGLKLELSDITEESFTKLLETILNDPSYETEVQKCSTLFRDRQNSPLEKAVWSIEYVLRHGGAPHLRSPARSLTYAQYYCVDIIVFLFGTLLVAAYVTLFIVRKMSSCMFISSSKTKNE